MELYCISLFFSITYLATLSHSQTYLVATKSIIRPTIAHSSTSQNGERPAYAVFCIMRVNLS
jgi:hypothetical protein